MIIRTNPKTWRVRPSDSTRSMRFSSTCKTKRPLWASSFPTSTTWWPWSRRTSSGHCRMLESRTCKCRIQVSRQRTRLIQPGHTCRAFMSSFYNLSLMRQLRWDHLRFTSLPSLCKSSWNCLIPRSLSRGITWRTFCISCMPSLYQDVKWFVRPSTSAFSHSSTRIISSTVQLSF